MRRILEVGPIDVVRTAVNDRLVHAVQTPRTGLLFENAGNHLRLCRDNAAVLKSLRNVQRIDMVVALGRDLYDLAAQCTGERRVFPFSVNDHNVIIRRCSNLPDGVFHAHRLTGAGLAKVESVRRRKLLAIAKNQVFGNTVGSEQHSTRLLNLLNPEWDKDTCALRIHCAKRMVLSHTDWKCSVQSVLLLNIQGLNLAGVTARSRFNCLCVAVQLFQTLCCVHHGQGTEEHLLIAACQAIQQRDGFFPLLLQRTGHRAGIIVVICLPSRIVCHGCFHTEKFLFHLFDAFIRWHTDGIQCDHHVAAQVCQIWNQDILHVGSDAFQKQNPTVEVSDLQIILVSFYDTRADVIQRIVAPANAFFIVESKKLLILWAVEVVEDPKTFCCAERSALNPHCLKTASQLGCFPVKVTPRLVFISLVHSNREIFVLPKPVSTTRSAQQRVVIVPAKGRDFTRLLGNPELLGKLMLIDTRAANGNHVQHAAVQAVEQLPVRLKDISLVFFACKIIVDVTELIDLGIPCSGQKQSVVPNSLDWDQILHSARYMVGFLILLQKGSHRPCHGADTPPFPDDRFVPLRLRSSSFLPETREPSAPVSLCETMSPEAARRSCRGILQIPSPQMEQRRGYTASSRFPRRFVVEAKNTARLLQEQPGPRIHTAAETVRKTRPPCIH